MKFNFFAYIIYIVYIFSWKFRNVRTIDSFHDRFLINFRGLSAMLLISGIEKLRVFFVRKLNIVFLCTLARFCRPWTSFVHDWTNEAARSTSVPFAFVRSSETPELLHVALRRRASLQTQFLTTLLVVVLDYENPNYQEQNFINISVVSLSPNVFPKIEKRR